MRRQRRYWAVSLVLSGLSLLAFWAYAYTHALFIRPLEPNELAWVPGMAKTVSSCSAVLALTTSIVAVIRGPRWLGAIAAAVALMACVPLNVTF